MDYTLKFDALIDIVIRLIIYCLFVLADLSEPFIREIRPEELWQYMYPVTPSYVPGHLLWFTIIATPSIVLLTDFCLTRNKNWIKRAFKCLTLAYPINGFITCLFKNIVGRPRPVFYNLCFPHGQGTDFRNCNGIRTKYMDGRKSFPSGHSSFAFTCMVFITLYLAKRLKLMQRGAGEGWKLCLCITPLVVAASIAASRTCDYHHHYTDVIAGSLLGATIAYVTFKVYFPKLDEVTIDQNSQISTN